jgi:hypothetical protein
MNNRKYTTPKMAARIYQIFNQVYRSGQLIDIIDYEVIAKDGSKVIFEGSVSLWRAHEGAGCRHQHFVILNQNYGGYEIVEILRIGE